ncbi:MAG: hypothetical protein SVG88_05630 [Halobacteriales archaeon]|nr:hypothetical protein [Halobacteriales archaeon]
MPLLSIGAGSYVPSPPTLAKTTNTSIEQPPEEIEASTAITMLQSVSEERVVRHWLAMELEKDGESLPTDPDSMSYSEAIDALLTRKPGAASFIWREQPIEWYRLELSIDRFRSLRTIQGPDGLLWQGLSPDGTIMGVARRISTEDMVDINAETEIDLDLIMQYRERVADGDSIAPFVIRTKRGKTPWYVADGNHRATALALHLIETGSYDPQPAFIGVVSNPILRPLRDRLFGGIDRLRGELIGHRS